MGTNRKKSNFPAKTTVLSGASFDYFVGGDNFQIPFTDLVSQLGVTGTLEQSGDPTATPVLDKQGSVNNIRNFKDGSGVKFSVGAQNDVVGSHNFIADSVGVPIFFDTTLTQPKFRSIVAGLGISVAATNGSVQIALSGAPTSSKTVIIDQISDFPTAVAGVITLEAETDYFLSTDITTSDRFNVSAGNIVVRASDSSIVAFTYTGTGDFFTGQNATFRVGRITLIALTGRIFNLTDNTGLALFQFIDGSIRGCDKVGLFSGPGSGYGAHQWNNVALFGVISDGLEFTGTHGAFLSFGNIGVMVNVGALFNLGTATFGSFNVDDSLVSLVGAGSFFLTGTTASGNIIANGLGTVLNTRQQGPGTLLVNITPDDDRWRFLLNDDIRDSRTDGLLSLQGNATETAIAGSSTDGSNAVLIAGTWVVESVSQMTGTTAGRLTHTGGKDARLPINVSLTLAPVSGGAIQLNAYVCVDGVIQVNSRGQTTASSGSPSTITLPWQNTYPDNGFSEIFVENTSNTVNILVSSARYVVN